MASEEEDVAALLGREGGTTRAAWEGGVTPYCPHRSLSWVGDGGSEVAREGEKRKPGSGFICY
jgi:hypothetical protein